VILHRDIAVAAILNIAVACTKTAVFGVPLYYGEAFLETAYL